MTRSPWPLFATLLLILSPATQATQPELMPYLPQRTLELAEYLPPPPPAGTAEDRLDLDTVLLVQRQRTPQQVEQAKRDDHLDDAAFPSPRASSGRSSPSSGTHRPRTSSAACWWTWNRR
ncbi:hypothetical protein ABS648_24730 [Pseudomonas solani]|uniref:Uncharacterized protein n=1 Tax=Pseudomonas solani TaxID=2731552 RepID=A0AAU7Y0G4_9PSED